MTPRQQLVVTAVGSFWASHGRAPSYDEIKQAVGLKSKGNLTRIVSRLVESGHLRRLPGRVRSLEVVKTVCCPNCGTEFDPRQARPRADA